MVNSVQTRMSSTGSSRIENSRTTETQYWKNASLCWT